MGHGSNAAAPEPVSEAFGWYARKARSDLNWIPSDTGCHILGAQNNPVFAELRAEFLRHGNSNAQPTHNHTALPGQSRERPDLSKLCAKDRCGWQRYRRYSSSGGPGTTRDVHRLGASRLAAGWRRL